LKKERCEKEEKKRKKKKRERGKEYENMIQAEKGLSVLLVSSL
jgi:hypothetical protein